MAPRDRHIANQEFGARASRNQERAVTVPAEPEPTGPFTVPAEPQAARCSSASGPPRTAGSGRGTRTRCRRRARARDR